MAVGFDADPTLRSWHPHHRPSHDPRSLQHPSELPSLPQQSEKVVPPPLLLQQPQTIDLLPEVLPRRAKAAQKKMRCNGGWIISGREISAMLRSEGVDVCGGGEGVMNNERLVVYDLDQILSSLVTSCPSSDDKRMIHAFELYEDRSPRWTEV